MQLQLLNSGSAVQTKVVRLLRFKPSVVYVYLCKAVLIQLIIELDRHTSNDYNGGIKWDL